MKNKYQRLAADIIIFIIGTVLAKAIQFILMPLYTSYMSTEAYGVAELTNNLAELFFPLATLCIYEAAFRYAVDSSFDNKKLVNVVSDVLAKSVVVGSAVSVAAFYLFHYKYAFYLLFILYAYSLRMCVAYYTRGIGKSKVFAASGVINALVLGIASYIFLVVIKLDVAGYLISIGTSYAVSALYLIIRSGFLKEITFEKIDSKDRNVLFGYCTPLIFYNLLYWFTTISGRYILMWTTDASTAGKYVAAIKISAVINMIQQAVYAAFQLNSSRAFEEENKEKYYSETNNLLISMYLAFGSLIICCTPILAKITLKNDFYDARIFLPIIMLAAIINCISSLLGTMYSTYKKTKRMVPVSIVGAAVNILVGLALAPSMGIWGVCIASLCCYMCQMIYKAFDIKTFCNIKYNLISSIISIALIFLQVAIMSTSAALSIYVSAAICILIFVVNGKELIDGLRQVMAKKGTGV